MGLGGLVRVSVVRGGGAYTGKGKFKVCGTHPPGQCVTRNTEAEEE